MPSRRIVRTVLRRAAGAALLAGAACTAARHAPTPSAGAFASGRYRNLFAEAGHPPAEVRRKLDAAFAQLFHGDSATEAVFSWAGTNADGRLAYLTDINNHDVRSEGMSYGMMIAVQMDHRAEFDALWNWARTYMYHADPAHPAYRFFSWSMKTDGTPNSESPAPDGEEYWAMALYFASARWGEGRGIYAYRAMADSLLDAMKNRGVITGPWTSRPTHSETDGAEFNVAERMVRFTPDLRRADHTDPSYHLPAFYELWGRWGPAADRAFWREAARTSRDFFQRTTHPVTGLAPEYAHFDGTPVTASSNPRSGTFGPDAWRTAANWAVDWAWWGADPRARAQRPDPGVLRRAGDRDVRQPVHARRYAARLDAFDGARRDQRGGEPRGDRHGTRPSVRRRAVGRAHPDGAVPVLRRHVVPDGAPALRRRVPHLDAGGRALASADRRTPLGARR
jgi:oligosaccharide reducing-end xylanase